jgi:hypothetical protein
MLGPAWRAVKANSAPIVLVCCLAVVTGCFWRRYPERLRIHGEVLVSTARKARDLVATGRFTAESVPELTYPLARAEAFAAESHRRSGATPPASLVAFEELLARYRAFVELVDETRRRERGAAAAERLGEPLAAVERAAREVTAALARERAPLRRPAAAG